jgi:hypothetical protein
MSAMNAWLLAALIPLLGSRCDPRHATTRERDGHALAPNPPTISMRIPSQPEHFRETGELIDPPLPAWDAPAAPRDLFEAIACLDARIRNDVWERIAYNKWEDDFPGIDEAMYGMPYPGTKIWLGLQMRDAWNLDGESVLGQYFRKRGFFDPYAMTDMILMAIHRRAQNRLAEYVNDVNTRRVDRAAICPIDSLFLRKWTVLDDGRSVLRCGRGHGWIDASTSAPSVEDPYRKLEALDEYTVTLAKRRERELYECKQLGDPLCFF